LFLKMRLRLCPSLLSGLPLTRWRRCWFHPVCPQS
jgi:hypothetical protein